jgi:Ni,Fe-hydrogenase III large subunit
VKKVCGSVYTNMPNRECYTKLSDAEFTCQPAPYIAERISSIGRCVQTRLLWVGLASRLIGFGTLFKQYWRIREPVIWPSTVCSKTITTVFGP